MQKRTATNPTVTHFILTAGQSLAEYYMHSSSGAAMLRALKDCGYATFPQIKNVAVGGTSVLKKFKLDGDLYWWDEDTSTAGPMLTAALAAIAAMGTKPVAIIWNQGQQDADNIVSSGDKAVYKSAMSSILGALRSACNSGSPTSVRLVIEVLGRRDLISKPNATWIREAHQDLAGSLTNATSIETYDLELADGTHPTNLGAYQQGWRSGRALANMLDGESFHTGPVIASIADSGNDVRVTITVESGETLLKPAAPFGFRFAKSGVEKFPTSVAWVGNRLDFTFAESGNNMEVTYIYGYVDDFDPVNIIRYDVPASPETSVGGFGQLLGLPLKSKAMVTA